MVYDEYAHIRTHQHTGVERVYALLDIRSGKVLNSFLHSKPGATSEVRRKPPPYPWLDT